MGAETGGQKVLGQVGQCGDRASACLACERPLDFKFVFPFGNFFKSGNSPASCLPVAVEPGPGLTVVEDGALSSLSCFSSNILKWPLTSFARQYCDWTQSPQCPKASPSDSG